MAHVDIPTDTLLLPGGGKFPLVGFGTWQLHGEECYEATLAALQAGYRHVDTATMYRNEAEVGRALRGPSSTYSPRVSTRWGCRTSTSGSSTPLTTHATRRSGRVSCPRSPTVTPATSASATSRSGRSTASPRRSASSQPPTRSSG